MSQQNPVETVTETVEKETSKLKKLFTKSNLVKVGTATVVGAGLGFVAVRAYQKNLAGEEISLELPDAIGDSQDS